MQRRLKHIGRTEEIIRNRLQKFLKDQEKEQPTACEFLDQAFKVMENDPAPTYHQGPTCFICEDTGEQVLATEKKGDYSICQNCIKFYHTEDRSVVSQMLKKDANYPIPINLNNPCGHIKDEGKAPVYLTLEDLRNLGATKDEINNYARMGLHQKGVQKDCHLCGNQDHQTLDCNNYNEQEVVKQLLDLHKKYGGRGSVLDKNRPCPYCGIVADKDEQCNHVTCGHCGKKWSFRYGKDEHDHSFVSFYRNYQLSDDIFPWVPPWDINQGHYTRANKNR